MIYGIVPVGGKGTRLNLPFDKELLPLLGYNNYYPVCQFTVDKLLEAECDYIYFIHGVEFKQIILNTYNDSKFIHIKNIGHRQSEVFSSFVNNVEINKNDIILYGLPDTIYDENNPFIKMKEMSGLVCGMFDIEDHLIVGRINSDSIKFTKSNLKEKLSNKCWGVLKIDEKNIKEFNRLLMSNLNYEVEDLLNSTDFSLIEFGKYWDLGTWKSINEYYKIKC